jgi:hypothetical protein
MKTLMGTTGIALLLSSAGAALASGQVGAELDGRWDAVLLDNGPAVPFRLDISGSGPTLKGTFYDGFASAPS